MYAVAGGGAPGVWGCGPRAVAPMTVTTQRAMTVPHQALPCREVIAVASHEDYDA